MQIQSKYKIYPAEQKDEQTDQYVDQLIKSDQHINR